MRSGFNSAIDAPLAAPSRTSTPISGSSRAAGVRKARPGAPGLRGQPGIFSGASA
jgi:hypothetical protein